jgi:hypothetical protein
MERRLGVFVDLIKNYHHGSLLWRIPQSTKEHKQQGRGLVCGRWVVARARRSHTPRPGVRRKKQTQEEMRLALCAVV